MPQLDVLSYFELISMLAVFYILGLVFIVFFSEIDQNINNIKRVFYLINFKNKYNTIFIKVIPKINTFFLLIKSN